MMIVAMFGFAGLVFAESGTPVQQIGPGDRTTKDLAADDENASGDYTPQSANVAFAAGPANDTCAGAVPLTLNLVTKGTTVGANNDYQTPANTTCYAGIGQTPTTAPGRDIVFSFTAPADGSYTIEVIQQSPNDAIRTQNEVLYQTDCVGSGVMNCIKGINRPQSAAFTSSTGSSNNQSEALDCIPMTTGQTVFVVFDDASPGKCSNNNHACFEDCECATGSFCLPSLNAGGKMSLDVRPCNREVEPNDTTATATPLVCSAIAESTAAPAAHCYQGTRAGAVCTRSGFLEQALPNSNMRCSTTGAQCVVDVLTGVSATCPLPALCQQQTDLDCDSRCDIGPNAGKSCTAASFCNPVSDQGAVCAGTCQIESTCIVTATNANTGVACTPVCVGGLFPGRYCSGLSGCPGGGVCTTTPAVGSPGATCGVDEECSRIHNEGDADYFSLGVVAAGDAIFAGVDGKASSDFDFRMRITTDTQTLQFDDDDVTSRGGARSPTIAGTPGTGDATFIKVSRTQPRKSSTYELFAHTRPPLDSAQEEDESVSNTGNDNYYLWPGDVLSINPISAGGYVKGNFGYNQDTDCFKFLVNKGDLLDMFGAANPSRTAGDINLVDHPQPLIYDAEPAGISNFGFGADPRRNTNANAPQPSLSATSPAVTSSYFQWRASYTGMMEVCYFAASQFLSQGVPDYPNYWSGSITANCGPVQNAGPGTTTTDVSVTKVGPAGPVAPGDFFSYTITVTNTGTEIAQEVALLDFLDANLTFLSLNVDDGFGDNNTACFSLPAVGDSTLNAAQPIYCVNASMAPGSTTTYVVNVQVNNCIGDGVVINNDVVLLQVSTDPNPANDTASASFTTVAAANNGCADLLCTGTGSSKVCRPNLCTTNDTCVGVVCTGGAPLACNDNSVCTVDTCKPATGCFFDNTASIALCNDNNACTENTCDPVLSCVYPPKTCNDNSVCTADSCNPTTGCVFDNSTLGALCDDDNACTTNACDPVLSCVFPVKNCDDHDACTGVESCDPATGCVAGTPLVCDDANACTGVETCDCDTGCVAGESVVCSDPADQCQVGICSPGTGLCSDANAPDGTTCNDGDAGTDPDACETGLCVGTALCDVQPKPKSSGYFKKLCKQGVPKPSHTDALTAADAACVGQLTATFAGISTPTDICQVFLHGSSGHDSNGPNGKECQKAEDELMGLALNICRQNVCLDQAVDSACGSGHDSHNRFPTTVGASLATTDGILSDPARNKTVCKDAKCLAKEINNGKGIHHVSLLISRAPANGTRLNWESPVMDDGSGEASQYTIWRRELNTDSPYVKITDTTAKTYVDNTAGTLNWEYEVTFTLEP